MGTELQQEIVNKIVQDQEVDLEIMLGLLK